MSVVKAYVASSGRAQTAVSSAPTTPMATVRPKLRQGWWNNHTIRPATTANTPTMRWLVTVSASSSAGSQRRRRVWSESAKVPRKNNANASASEKENSPAIVLAIVPPMMCWLNAIDLPASVRPGSPVQNMNAVAATAIAAGAGRGARNPRPSTYAAMGRSSDPSAVPILNATL